MLIDQLNLNQIRIFECVYRTRNMTVASKELHLTQSGISQHIKALESFWEVRLFDRIKKGLVPTSEGTLLYERCSRSLKELEEGLTQVKGGKNQLHGTVSIGMPVEFGNNLVLPALAKFAEKNPFVKFKFRLEYATAINPLLLRGELDFAFVDDYMMDKNIHTEAVYDEVLELCASKEWAAAQRGQKQSLEYFESLRYIEYAEDEPILRMWFGHHFGTRNLNLNVQAIVMDVQGVARLIQSGIGVGVVPGHLLHKLKKEGTELHIFKGSGRPLVNRISLAYLKDRSHSQAVQAAMDVIRAELKSLNQKRKSPGGSK